MSACPRCGRSNAREFRFCPSCGAELADAGRRAPPEDTGVGHAHADLRSSNSGAQPTEGALAFARAFGVLVGELQERAALALTTPEPPMRGSGTRLPVVPSAPRRPSARARALIHAYTGTQKILRSVGIVITLVGLVPAALLGTGLLVDVALWIGGRVEPGVVVAIQNDPNVRINNTRPRLITFKVGEHEGTSSTLDFELAGALAPGGPCEVELIPGVPWASRVKGTMASRALGFGAFVWLFPAIGVALFGAAVRSNRREVRAFTHGVSTVGRVISYGPDLSTTVNGRHPTMLRFMFEVRGTAYSGSLTHMDSGAIEGLVAEGKVPVLYDAADPTVNTLYVA